MHILLSNGSEFGKNRIIFGGNMSSSAHNDILVLGKVPTDGLNDTTLTPENEYSINFTEQQNKFLFKFAL